MGKTVEFNAEWQRKKQEIQVSSNMEIKIQFKNLLRPLEEQEYKELEESLQEYGCREPLVLWKGLLLDGHNRYEICMRHNIPFTTVEYDFPNIHRAKIWMFKNQCARRNITDFCKAKYGLLMKEEYAKEAKEVQKSGVKQSTFADGDQSNLLPNLGEGSEEKTKAEGWTDRKIAADTGVSHGNIYKTEKLLEKGTPEEIKDLESGKLSIHRGYEDLKKREQQIIGFPSDEKYQVFYCDPYVRDITSLSGWRRKNFICQPSYLPIPDVSASQAALFLWSPAHYLEKSLKLMKSWGFTYDDMLIWKLKEPIESHQILNTHVMIIIGTTGGCVPISGIKPQSIVEDTDQGSRHDQVRRIIEKMYPDGKKLELLAHEKKEGWNLYKGDGTESASSY